MKKNKIPGIFLKSYTEKTLNKKILKRIYIPKDKKMIQDLFQKNSDGNMEIIGEIPEKVKVRMKDLAKSIKKNKGMVSRWKALIVLFIITSIIIFSLFFKDKLVSKAVDRGLEAVFQAEVEIRELKISLFKGLFSFQHLSIGDSGNPSRNLLETGPSEFRISIAELTRKRILIKEMSLTEVNWNTPRGKGEISGESTDTKQNIDGGDSKGVLDLLSVDSDDFDFKTLFDGQKDNLASLNLINEQNKEIDALTKKWNEIYSEKDKEIEALSDEITSLKSLSLQDTGSISEGQALVQQVKGVYVKTSNTKDGLLVLQNDFQEDKNHIMDMEGIIQTAMDDDIAYLEDLIDLSSGDMRSLASDLAEKYIRNRWNNYYENALKAYKIYKQFKNREDSESEENKGIQRDRGRTISFPQLDNPDFLIDHILLSGGNSKTGNLIAEIWTISSEPDKLTEPLTFFADWRNGQSSLKVDGFIDMRSGAEKPFELSIQSPENLITLEDGLSAFKISRLRSSADISGVSNSLKDQNTVITVLDIFLTSIDIQQEDDESLVSEALKEILDEVEQIDIKAKIIADWNGLKEVNVQSDLDNILSDRLGGYMKEMSENAAEELKASLTEYLASSLQENQILKDSLSELGVDSLDQISSAGDLGNSANDILKDLNPESKASAEVEEKVQAEAENLIDQAKDKIKIPGF